MSTLTVARRKTNVLVAAGLIKPSMEKLFGKSHGRKKSIVYNTTVTCLASCVGMSRLQSPSSLKRKQPKSKSANLILTRDEKLFCEAIRVKEGNGIWARDLKQEIKHLPDREVTKVLKSLFAKGLIKDVVNVRNKGRKLHYVAAEFEPSTEITGGSWYTGGDLDLGLIEALKRACFGIIKKEKLSTAEKVTKEINNSAVVDGEMKKHQIEQILALLVCDGRVVEARSSGMGEFSCYSIKDGRQSRVKDRAMTSIP